MGAPGTLESLARQLGLAVAPLQDLNPQTAPVVCYDLGIAIPPAVLAAPAFTAALAATAAAAVQLTAQVDALTAAVDAGDEAGMLAAAAPLLATARTVLDSLAAVEGQLPGSSFTTQLVAYLVVRYLEYAVPMLANLLTLAGIVDRLHLPGVPGDPSQPPRIVRALHLDRLSRLLSDPLGLLQDVYQWGSPAFDGTQLMQLLADALADMPYPAAFSTAADGSPLLTSQYFDLGVDRSTSPAGLRLLIHVPLAAGFTDSGPLASSAWTYQLATTATLTAETAITVSPPATATAQAPSGTLAGSFTLAAVADPVSPANEVVLFGQTGGSRLAAQHLSAGAGLTLTAAADGGSGTGVAVAPLLQIQATGGRLVIDTAQADGFLASFLSGSQISAGFDLAATWQPSTGFQFHGSAGIEITAPLAISLGPLALTALHLVIGLGSAGALAVELSVGAAATLGPVEAAVDRLGATAVVTFPASGGNLGPAHIDIQFKPPSGLGISINAGPITGGGYIYFDPPSGRYAGVLSLTLYSVQVNAIALLDTQLPSGESGYSFLIVISVEFAPIQLGLGFTLNGVGGLCGINRDFATAALQAGLRAHSLDHILFPADPIRNAPAILSDLRTVFPPALGRYAFGPMLKLGWGGGIDLVTAELGVLLVLPSPLVIAVLGQVSVTVPSPDAAIVELHLETLGIIDFGQKLFSLDATLHDSHIALYTVYGDMAMRLSWGDNPSFALAIGGLNPHFQPPDGFPTLKRVTLSLAATDDFRLSIQTYLAITSNTFQLGAKAELYAGASSFNVYGWLGFDALFLFQPFSFVVDFTAGLALRSGTDTLMGISVDGSFSGPTPWHIKGDAHVSLLFFDIDVPIDVTWGDSRQIDPPRVDAWPLLQQAIANLGNWSGSLPSGIPAPVTLARPQADAATVLVDPSGVLTLRERLLPLDMPLTKFGEAMPGPQATFTLDQVTLGGNAAQFTRVSDLFAPAQFTAMSDQDKLSSPSFEDRVSGFAVGAGQLAFGRQFGIDFAFADRYVDDFALPRLLWLTFVATRALQVLWAQSNGAARSPLRATVLGTFAPPPTTQPLVTLAAESFVIASVDDLSQRPDLSPPTGKSAALAALAAHLAKNPADRGQLQVVPLHELAA